MILNIKSIFITKKVFSFLNEAKKLKLIKYNKNMQSKLNINLVNYKTLSGRYIIFETKQKGKEYDSHDDKLIYEGEYLDGKRWNGKGNKYFFDGKLKFEGEYLNGKKWNGQGYDGFNNIAYQLKNGNGAVKKYYSNGNLEFVGEYLNGEKKGIIKKYFYNGNLEFEGQYLNGKRNGKGKVYD